MLAPMLSNGGSCLICPLRSHHDPLLEREVFALQDACDLEGFHAMKLGDCNCECLQKSLLFVAGDGLFDSWHHDIMKTNFRKRTLVGSNVSGLTNYPRSRAASNITRATVFPASYSTALRGGLMLRQRQ